MVSTPKSGRNIQVLISVSWLWQIFQFLCGCDQIFKLAVAVARCHETLLLITRPSFTPGEALSVIHTQSDHHDNAGVSMSPIKDSPTGVGRHIFAHATSRWTSSYARFSRNVQKTNSISPFPLPTVSLVMPDPH